MDFILEKLKELMAIPSPSGFTKAVAQYTVGEFKKLGYPASLSKKGGVLVDLGGEGNPIVLAAHIDTLGGMVAEVKANGRLRLTRIGGLQPQNVECENCTVYTRFGKTYTGCMQINNPSVHVNTDYTKSERTFDGMEVVIDEKVFTKEETEALGISTGDYVCFDPRTTITESGYIKSRFLDDKLSVAILMGFAKRLKETGTKLNRRTYLFITVYEEVGHGCSSLPADVDEILCVDMGCVGDGLACKEHQVSICAKDLDGPYDYEVTTELIRLAKEGGLDYAVDVYPHYSSDAATALHGGADIRHALIGAGVYASHGYERSHVDGVKNTLDLLLAYLTK